MVLKCVASDIFADGARNALSLEGTMLGFYPVRVLPSKTAIAPVNPTFLPRVSDLVHYGQILVVVLLCLN